MLTTLNISLLLSCIVYVQHFHRCAANDLNDPPPLCSAYEMLIVNTQQCVARCPIHCENDVCFEDGECPCKNSYMTACKRGLVCAQKCLLGCVEAGGYCATPDICICKHKGYMFEPISQRCIKRSPFKDKCRGRCTYGHCSTDGVCTCANGFKYSQSVWGQLCLPQCKQNCGPRGYCFLPNMCTCRKKHEHYGPDGKCYHDDHDYVF